jgi:hypothetical protein
MPLVRAPHRFLAEGVPHDYPEHFSRGSGSPRPAQAAFFNKPETRARSEMGHEERFRRQG